MLPLALDNLLHTLLETHKLPLGGCDPTLTGVLQGSFARESPHSHWHGRNPDLAL